MRLQDYWGVGPKTAERLRDALGTEGAVAAIESADVRALADAGVTPGRAVRILRRATGAAAMDLFATPDAREVYDDLLSLAGEHALTRQSRDRIRVLTPLPDHERREERLDDVTGARDAWRTLDDDARRSVLDAFEAYDEAGETPRAAVACARTLRDAGLGGETFPDLAGLDVEALADAADALGAVDGGLDALGDDPDDLTVGEGADAELDRRRARLAAAEDLAADALDVLETVRAGGVRDLDDLRSAFVEHVAGETGVAPATVRAATADDAADAADFASTSLRELVADLDERVAEREAAVAADLAATLDAAGRDARAAVEAVDEAAMRLSLARFSDAYDLRRPTFVADGLAVEGARNPFLLAGEETVQPVDYAVGAHDLSPPSDDRVAVLTGANSGGKTTLLETLCAVTTLAAMGLPVPAERAAVGRIDAVVFHRRHASFNAGVLESTLRSVVPPLTTGGRTLMLVDEFEAITEPGRAADLLNGLVELTVDREALGVYVTHLADDLSPLPDPARVDGIFAEGLTGDLDLRVDYQPRFRTLGRSTPEFIVSRLVANAADPAERRGFEALAGAVGEEVVQRTLDDARWAAEGS
ncbi:MAG: helix-hairpin-helix domain-containing protein [Haloferacaceae archaeon]